MQCCTSVLITTYHRLFRIRDNGLIKCALQWSTCFMKEERDNVQACGS